MHKVQIEAELPQFTHSTQSFNSIKKSFKDISFLLNIMIPEDPE